MTNTFYILEHPCGNRFFGYDRESCCFGWDQYLPERAEKFNSYQDAKNFIKSNNIYINQYLEEFLNCKIKKLTITVELFDCEE